MSLAKKSQGLPIHVIIIILIGVIVLAIILMYVFGIMGTASANSNSLFNIGGNITKNATNSISYG